jgi:large subunit ribosomal protein L15
MVKLSDLSPNPGSRKKRDRVGRGIASGSGKTSGRGTKGAGARGRTSRKGAQFEGGQLPLVRRLPFKRGFNNIFKIRYQEVNIGEFDIFKPGVAVTPELMADAGFIRDALGPVVVLGMGELTSAIEVYAHRFSRSALEAIEKAGGSAYRLALPATGAAATVKLPRREALEALRQQAATKTQRITLADLDKAKDADAGETA